DVIVPLRQLLPGVQCRTEEVRNIDLKGSRLEYEGYDGQTRRLDYDHVILACGNISNLNVVPGMADHAYPLKTVGDAAVLRTHILSQMERAEVCDDPARRRWYLSFLVVGGGYSGVETAGEINDLVRTSRRFYKNIGDDDITVTLIHSRDQLLPEISPQLREFARGKMEKAGVTMKLNARVQLATGEGVGLKDDFVHGGTIVCTIGSTTAPVIERLDSPKEKGRLLTEPDMRLRGSTNAWAIGDCANIINAHDGQPSPPTGQFAERQGRQCANNIVRIIGGEPTRPFSFKVLGQLCSIGGHSAVAEMFGFRLSGFLAWFTWRGVYLFKLPSWSRRVQVGFDWAWLLIFPRDLSCIKTDTTDRVSHSHYEPGDYIVKQGEPPASFYVIEQGEVEIVRASPEMPKGEVIATLGSGSFFGEQALLNNQPRAASVRARTTVDVVVMGKNVFTTISKTLAPLRNALTAAIARRTPAAWQERPRVRAALKEFALAEFIEPAPQPLLKPTATLREVTREFGTSEAPFFFASADGARLDGLVTLTDLLNAQATGLPPETPLADFMVQRLNVILATDSCLIAAAAFREHGNKTLPVVADAVSRRIVGYIRARKLIARIMQVVGTPTTLTAPPVTPA
ncbi:MAG: Pyridine nucleotide-disulfide oxidoreductase, FAD/NAD(P)-binding domain protein, partial [Lacunisphaera sp.]|nr:Pyridine nucleotide-disulfide oxidoreductase, FAD/NAD(P)-binding domain protein [Lacunisphaera sp.]